MYEYENNHNYSNISSVDCEALSLKHHMSVCYQPIARQADTFNI